MTRTEGLGTRESRAASQWRSARGTWLARFGGAVLLGVTVLSACGDTRQNEAGTPSSTASTPAQGTSRDTGLTSAQTAEIARKIFDSQFAIRKEGAKYRTSMPGRDLSATFDESGVSVIAPSSDVAPVRLRATAIGRGAKLTRLGTPSLALGACLDEDRVDESDECIQRLELTYDGVVEWWSNEAMGLEHGFSIAEPPEGRGPLTVRVGVEGARVEVDAKANEARLIGAAGASYRYGELVARDSTGRKLMASLETAQGGLALRIDDGSAQYPIAIDPILNPSPDRTASSPQSGSSFGLSIAVAGDLNRDGCSDVLVGAPDYDGVATDTGKAYLYFGCQGSASIVASWSDESSQAGARFGAVVAAAGDVNGDGLSDIAIGAPLYDFTETDEGVVFVYHGMGSSVGSAWMGRGNLAGARYGSAIAFGDIGRDGYSDLAIGAPGHTNDTGRAYVYYGSSSGLPATENWSKDGTAPGALMGSALAFGDFDGDGDSSLAVGMPGYSATTAGAGAVRYFDATGNTLSTSDSSALGLSQVDAHVGSALATVGDIDGSGQSYLLLGVPDYDAAAGTDAGLARLYGWDPTANGGQGWFTQKWEGTGATAGAHFGYSVAGLGDINGDEFADWAVGAPDADINGTDTGAAYYYYGSSSGSYSSTFDASFAGDRMGIAVSSAGDFNRDGSSDVLVSTSSGIQLGFGRTTSRLYDRALSWYARPPASTTTGFGKAIGGAGDVNGDGFIDVIVGAPDTSNGETSEGRVHVYYGSATGPYLDGAAAPATAASWTAESNVAGARFGAAVARAGDVNGDGYGDVIVGAPNFANGESDEGAIYVFHGSASGLAASPAMLIEGGVAGRLLGTDVDAAGDVNGDGFADVIVGAPGDNGGAGVALVYHGSASGLSTTPTTTISGSQSGSACGRAVAGLGDVNNDGYTDVAVGTPLFDAAVPDDGKVSVYLGSSSGVSTAPVFNASGDGPSGEFGGALASAGDVDGNGYADLIVGAKTLSLPEANEGRVYVYRGSSSGFGQLSTFTWESNTAGDEVGESVAAADVNGDGYSDAIVAGSGYSAATGRSAIVLYGSAGGITLTGNSSFASGGGSIPAMRVAALGDVDADGLEDVITSVIRDGMTPYDGLAYVYLGGDPHTGANLAGIRLGTTPAGSAPLAFGGRAGTAAGINVVWKAPRLVHGRTRAKLAYDTVRAGDVVETFDGRSEYGVVGYQDTSAELSERLSAVSDASAYRVRVRLVFDIASTVTLPATRWRTFGPLGWPAMRTGSCATNLRNDGTGGTCNICTADHYGWPTCSYCTRAETCGGHGSCNSSAGCSCDAGYAGSSCQYSNAANCNNHGTVQADGTCVCASGYAGSSCQYSDAVQCSSHGSVQADGTCVCATGYVGASCQYSDATTCSGHGTANADGSCTCEANITGARCDVCMDGYFAYPSCTYCDAQTTCNGAGTCDASGTCVCATNVTGAHCDSCAAGYSGYPACTTFCDASTTCNGQGSCTAQGTCLCNVGMAGTSCQYSSATLCNDHGAAQADGTCVCNGGYAGANCEYCPDWDVSTGCQHSDAITCHGNGTYTYFQEADVWFCACRTGCVTGYVNGVNEPCLYCDDTTCSGHGTAQSDGTCVCNDGNYTGAHCDQCAPDCYGPSCTYCYAPQTCNGRGTCGSSGECVCNAGSVGSSCQYTDAGTCSGHGTAQADGSCVCTSPFTGTSCSQCVTGYAGSSCQYTDATTCNGHGTAQSDGSCVCANGYAGTHCESIASDLCSGHGSAQGGGACVCNAGFDGTLCDQCAPSYFGYPSCTYCADATTCSGHGTCSAQGTCTCSSGFTGTSCQHSDATTCSSHGTAQADGTCLCTGNFTGAHCDQCAAGTAGSSCQYTDATTCSGHGTAQADGSCVCAAGFGGASCQYSAATLCNSHGSVTSSGTCACDAGFTGAACDACSADYVGYPSCRYCNASTTCNGRGTCSASGDCVCASGATGTNCEYTDASTCSGHGHAQTDGSCLCDAGFTGPSCAQCAADYFGYPSCTSCLAQTTCSGHGSCAATGGCTCAPGFAGAACDQCAPGFYGYPTCKACDASITCRGRGTCNDSATCDCNTGFTGAYCQYSGATSCSGHGAVGSDGTCACEAGFAGSSCQTCAAGYVGFPSCRQCDAATTCHGHGICSASGVCECSPGYVGVGCEYSRDTTCSGHGAPTSSGSCTCDSGYAGPSCQYSRTLTCSGHGTPQASGACGCDAGYAGAACEFSQQDTCNGHGIANPDGSCTCMFSYTGPHCEQCGTDRYDYPRCVLCNALTCNAENGQCLDTGVCKCKPGTAGPSCQYTDSGTCSGHGVASFLGSCKCAAGYAGKNCQYGRAWPCSNRGDANDDGSCRCDNGYAGAACLKCAADYYDLGTVPSEPMCGYCQRDDTCSGHGSCSKRAECQCDAGYAGSHCEFSDAKTCSGHGIAQHDGSCACKIGWGGKSCDKCATDYYGASCQTYCNAVNTCAGRGNCDTSGRCVCMPDSYKTEGGSCAACPAGHSCADPASKPELCAKGTYSPGGLQHCKRCDQGTYAANEGASQCSPCSCADNKVCTDESCDATTGKCLYRRALACSLCGNGQCDKAQGEDCSLCARDCGTCYTCGDGMCDAQLGENCWSCGEDCKACDTYVPIASEDPYYTPPTPPKRPDGIDIYHCSGRPTIPDSQKLRSFDISRENDETPSMFGTEAATEFGGKLAWGYEFDADKRQCVWTSDVGLDAEQCIKVGPTWEVCGELGIEYESQCTQSPLCDAQGYRCELGGKHDWTHCESELSFEGALALKYGIDADLGPFYAEADVSAGIGIALKMSTEWGSDVYCGYAEESATTSEALFVEGKATASAGFKLSGLKWGVHAEASACFGLKYVGTRGCNPSILHRQDGAELSISVPTFGTGFVSFPAKVYTWEENGGCK